MKLFISIVLLLFIINGCSVVKIDQLELFKKVEIDKGDYLPSSRELDQKKYFVKIDEVNVSNIRNINYSEKFDNNASNDFILKKISEKLQTNIYEYLQKQQNLKLFVKNRNKCTEKEFDFEIRTKVNHFLILKSRIIFSGMIELYNSKFDILEQSYPINFSIFRFRNESLIESLTSFSDQLNLQLYKTSIILELSYKRGFIIAKREDDDNNVIFQINLGNEDAISQGSKLSIYSIEKRKNILSQKEKLAKIKVATAFITKQLDKKTAWIQLFNSQLEDKIKLGYMVIMSSNRFRDLLEDGKYFIKNNSEMLDNKIRFK